MLVCKINLKIPYKLYLGRYAKVLKISQMSIFLINLYIFTNFLLLSHLTCYAQISNLNCTITTPNDLTKKYNAQQNVVISTSWQGGTPPFAVTFKANGIAIGTINTSSTNANFTLSAMTLPEGNNTFSVNVIETAVPSASPPVEASAIGVLQIDKTPPTINLKIVSGQIVSPNPGTNIVLLSFSSNEALAQPPSFVISPGSWPPPSSTSSESPPYTSNQYTITIPPSTPSGVYTVTVTAFDNTEPASSRNWSLAQVSFRVIAEVIGSPVITHCSPNSPFNTTYLTLYGTVPSHSETQTVEVLENGVVKARVSIPPNATNWNADINAISNGEHIYIARRIDYLGNISPPSPEFKVIADRIPPNIPQLEPFIKPVNKKRVTIRGSNAKDPQFDSKPVKVSIYSLGFSSKLAEVVADDSGNFICEVELPNIGLNHIYAQSADTTYDNVTNLGNISSFSNIITINVDTTPPTIATGGIVISANTINTTSPTLTYTTSPTIITPTLHHTTSIASSNELLHLLHNLNDFINSPQISFQDTLIHNLHEHHCIINFKTDSESEILFIPKNFITNYCQAYSSLKVVYRICQNINPNSKHKSSQNLKPKPTPKLNTQQTLVKDYFTSPQKSNSKNSNYNLSPKNKIIYPHTIIPIYVKSGFIIIFPNSENIFYKFEITDNQNKKIYIPQNGEFFKSAQKLTSLKIQQNSTYFHNNIPLYDVWPINELGYPAKEIFLKYRVVILSFDLDNFHIQNIKRLLQTDEELTHILIECESSSNSNSIQIIKLQESILKDINLLMAGKLSPIRVNLLLNEIISGTIKSTDLPHYNTIPNLPHYKKIKETIRFLYLHNSIPGQ